MANRRMFSKRITNSGRFLKMPATSQTLYFHLGLDADDDGIVEAYKVIKLTNANEDDLKVLITKDFIKMLNDDLVVVILDWREHNLIRADRKVDSIYKDLLQEKLPDFEVLEAKDRADRPKDADLGRPTDNQWAAQVRLGQVRLDTTADAEIHEEEEETTEIEDADGNFITVPKKKKKPVLPVKPRLPIQKFDYMISRGHLEASHIIADQIIAFFFKFKNYYFDNPEMMQAQVKRNSKAAKELEGYSKKQIETTMWDCEKHAKENNYDWGLETVLKRIANIVNK